MYVWLPSTTSNTATPTIRYLFSISRGQPRTITDPPMLWPTSFGKKKQSTKIHKRNMLYLLKERDNLMDPEKGFEPIRKSQQQERQLTSHCRSLLWKMSFLEFCLREILKPVQYGLVTMSSSIQRKHTTLSFCHLCNLFGKTGETETWVSCTMMANHNSPIIGFRWGVIDTTI